MKKIIASLLVVSVIVSGCSLFKKDPQKAVNEGISQFSTVKKLTSKLTVKGTVKSPTGEKPEKIDFTIEASGKSDLTDTESPLVDMVFKLSASADDMKGSGEIQFRTVDKKIYVNVSKI